MIEDFKITTEGLPYSILRKKVTGISGLTDEPSNCHLPKTFKRVKVDNQF